MYKLNYNDMQEGPTLLQRKAIGRMINFIQSSNPTKWGTWLWEDLENWNIENGDDISLFQYYSTLKSLPPHPKREIINSILDGWNHHHDIKTLYDSIISLICLKVCNSSEYFLLQQIFNFLTYFSDVCESDNDIFITRNPRNHIYTLRFTKGEGIYGASHGIIDFQLNDYNQDPIVAIVPWYSLLSVKYVIPDELDFDESDIEDFVANNLYSIIKNEFAKKHCPWIYSNWEIDVKEDKLKRGIVIILHSLEYEDNNGDI